MCTPSWLVRELCVCLQSDVCFCLQSDVCFCHWWGRRRRRRLRCLVYEKRSERNERWFCDLVGELVVVTYVWNGDLLLKHVGVMTRVVEYKPAVVVRAVQRDAWAFRQPRADVCALENVARFACCESGPPGTGCVHRTLHGVSVAVDNEPELIGELCFPG